MAIRQRVDPDQKGARATTSNARDLKELAASIVKTVLPIVQNSAAQITALLSNYLTIAAASTTYALLGHKHSWSDITTSGTTGAGGTVGGDLAVTGRMTATTGINSTGARNNQVTTGYVAAYLDSNGNLGYAPSTLASKNVVGPYAVDMSKFLAVQLFQYTYKSDPNATMRMGPIADYLDQAGLSEFVVYGNDGTIQGIRFETLVFGLWSAYVQSRTSTLARIAKQSHQTYTNTAMTALALGGTKNYTVTWPTPFADADYLVVPSVVNSSGVAVAGATAAVVPGSKTTTGCTVSVAAGIALLANQTLVVEGMHV